MRWKPSTWTTHSSESTVLRAFCTEASAFTRALRLCLEPKSDGVSPSLLASAVASPAGSPACSPVGVAGFCRNWAQPRHHRSHSTTLDNAPLTEHPSKENPSQSTLFRAQPCTQHPTWRQSTLFRAPFSEHNPAHSTTLDRASLSHDKQTHLGTRHVFLFSMSVNLYAHAHIINTDSYF